MLSITSRVVRFFRAEIDMFCGDQKRVGNCEKAAASQRNGARKIGQLFCDDVVVFQIILQSFVIFELDEKAKAFVVNDRKLSIRVSVVLAPT